MKFSLPEDLMLRKTTTKKKSLKFKNPKFLKTEKKWSGDMVDRYFSTKFGINLLDGF